MRQKRDRLVRAKQRENRQITHRNKCVNLGFKSEYYVYFKK